MADLRVLLCDDDPDLLGLLNRRLEKMGLEHEVADDGRKAKALIDQQPFDVIVTDIYMPEATGLEVLQYSKQKDPDVQVVIITSAATLENAIDALNHGAFGYLTKPFDHLIVFDNMVSRAAEYRRLLVANKHKAEAQKRRGDMLEDEVAQRVQQIQKKQKGLLDLLGSLPDGILVVEEGGKVVLSSPVGERWLARDGKSEHQPIHGFIAQVNGAAAERNVKARVEEHDLQLIAVDFPAEGEVRRKAVIIREIESDGIGAGSLVTETVMGIKKGLATLYQQGVGTAAVLNLASQFAVLEQLAGWTKPEGGASPTQPVSQETEEPITNIGIESPPVEEPEGPKLNTAELSDALRAAARADAEPALPQLAAESLTSAEPVTDLSADLASHGFPLDEAPASDPAPRANPAMPAQDPSKLETPSVTELGDAMATGTEPAFPMTQPGVLDPVVKPVDTGLFRPRIIPEAMSAKLGEPPAIQPSDGKRGPIRLGSSAANTRIFRRVLEKMSGETVIGPEEPTPEPATPAEHSKSRNGDQPAAEANLAEPDTDPVAALRELAVAAARDFVPEPISQPASAPMPKSKPKEPEPKPVLAKKAVTSWPPTLPSTDPEWDDSLETKG